MFLDAINVKSTLRGLYGAATATALIGCATPIDQYVNNAPTLSTEYFVGESTAHGIVKDWKGKVIRYFNAELTGYREGDNIILDELFIFDDGTTQTRQWTFEPSKNGAFIATAPDVIGDAEGSNQGNAMYLEYDLEVDNNGDKIVLRARDQLFLTNEETMLSESTLYKFGLPVLYVTLVINKTP